MTVFNVFTLSANDGMNKPQAITVTAVTMPTIKLIHAIRLRFFILISGINISVISIPIENVGHQKIVRLYLYPRAHRPDPNRRPKAIRA